METSGHPKTELDGIRIRPRQGGREAAGEDGQEAQGQEGYAYLLHQQQRRRGAAYG